MGSSESKIVEAATPKPDAFKPIRNERVGRLVDPRSPSAAIDRTPIQVAVAKFHPSVQVTSDVLKATTDPRSPSVGVTRTPMKVTVGSFARRLGKLFFSETACAEVPAQRSSTLGNFNVEEEEVTETGEIGSSEPLLIPQSTPSKHRDAPTSNLQLTGGDTGAVLTQSPFVLLEEAQVEVEADLTLEEAEEARETPLHKRLSMSLITCHEGDVSAQVFADVHHDCPLSPPPSRDVQLPQEGPDHSYALPSIVSEQECPLKANEPSVHTVDSTTVPASPEQVEEDATVLAEAKPMLPVVQESLKSVSAQDTILQATAIPEPGLTQQLQPTTGIRCPVFDSKSPSQVVFKPQWLGKGFGATGLRARGVQVRGSKGGSSPLSVRVAVKNVSNENSGPLAKQKQKGNGLSEGRSPLQILKASNSPRDHNTQSSLSLFR